MRIKDRQGSGGKWARKRGKERKVMGKFSRISNFLFEIWENKSPLVVGPCRVFAPQTDLRGVVGVNRLGLLHIAEHRGADSTLR